jgi:uncharacterized surface protein with fasciclin (FAS1) repeats
MRPDRLTILFVALVVAVPLVLAACGGEDEQGEGASAATATAPATATPSATGTPSATATAAAQPDIVATAAATGDFVTLVAALDAAGLTETLEGEGPYTVFAPTDDAFAELPQGTLESLMTDPQGGLIDVLTYHVVEGELMSAGLSHGTTVTTLQGGELIVSVRDGTVFVNDAKVLTPDVDAANGVIHVIDAVLVPAGAGGML